MKLLLESPAVNVFLGTLPLLGAIVWGLLQNDRRVTRIEDETRWESTSSFPPLGRLNSSIRAQYLPRRVRLRVALWSGRKSRSARRYRENIYKPAQLFSTSLKIHRKLADGGGMDPRTFVDTAAPTPFGWVITTQSQFDLDTIISFRSQLASLSKFFESQQAVAPAVVESPAEAEVLEPVPVRAA